MNRLLEIFPDIFEGIYGFTAGESGLAFVMMFAGSIITLVCSWLFDRCGQKWVRRHPNKQPEYLRLPLACVGGPLFVIALFWLGWTARASIHWVVPLLSMIPYGIAYQMIFMAMINCKFMSQTKAHSSSMLANVIQIRCRRRIWNFRIVRLGCLCGCSKRGGRSDSLGREQHGGHTGHRMVLLCAGIDQLRSESRPVWIHHLGREDQGWQQVQQAFAGRAAS